MEPLEFEATWPSLAGTAWMGVGQALRTLLVKMRFRMRSPMDVNHVRIMRVIPTLT